MTSAPQRSIKRVLIANRGEIALRIIRALKELEIESVQVYSEPDEHSLATRMADYAYPLGGKTALESYLSIPKIMAILAQSGADAVHPGYGFLSENEDFCAAVSSAGAKFIGPSVHSMSLLGNKISAKKLMRAHNVPVSPGSIEALSSWEEIKTIAREIGFPLILKAAHGGGGRGMRVVRAESELEAAFAGATREAQNYFGNPAVFCERYIDHPRHIEVQVLCDAHGSGVHLFERDCSVQRRHQKLIEEAPSVYLNEEQRARLGSIAVKAALAARYEGVGTVEFICESPEEIYFMEINTRIQVEHPVSESITGIDLVHQQLKVAMGEPLGFRQEDLKLKGTAIELRINAEYPWSQFTPGPGRITRWHMPSGPGIRVDTHAEVGFEVSPYYDSMIAKLIAWAPTRGEAIKRLLRALSEMEIQGVPTTASFHEAVLRHPEFHAGKFHTHWVEQNYEELKKRVLDPKPEQEDWLDFEALLAAILCQEARAQSPQLVTEDYQKLWADAQKIQGLRT